MARRLVGARQPCRQHHRLASSRWACRGAGRQSRRPAGALPVRLARRAVSPVAGRHRWSDPDRPGTRWRGAGSAATHRRDRRGTGAAPAARARSRGARGARSVPGRPGRTHSRRRHLRSGLAWQRPWHRRAPGGPLGAARLVAALGLSARRSPPRHARPCAGRDESLARLFPSARAGGPGARPAVGFRAPGTPYRALAESDGPHSGDAHRCSRPGSRQDGDVRGRRGAARQPVRPGLRPPRTHRDGRPPVGNVGCQSGAAGA
jgi:hypothetical protein